jgi:hypothetical protein
VVDDDSKTTLSALPQCLRARLLLLFFSYSSHTSAPFNVRTRNGIPMIVLIPKSFRSNTYKDSHKC